MGSPYEYDLGGMTLLVKEVKTGFNTPHSSSTARQVTAAGSTLAMSRASHLGKTILLDTASGSVVTLPASAGTGDTYTFVVTTTVSSNNHIIKVANATDTMIGIIDLRSPAGTPTNHNDVAGGTDDTLTMNGTTTGGVAGTVVTATDISSGLWLIMGDLAASGNAATGGFSATVS